MPPFIYSSPDAGFWDTLVVLSLSEALDGSDASPPLSQTAAEQPSEPSVSDASSVNIDPVGG